MKESRSEILWNEEIRRCGVVDIAEKMKEARLRWCGHVIRKDGDIIELEIKGNKGREKPKKRLMNSIKS
jgi:hypothetical protein